MGSLGCVCRCRRCRRCHLRGLTSSRFVANHLAYYLSEVKMGLLSKNGCEYAENRRSRCVCARRDLPNFFCDIDLSQDLSLDDHPELCLSLSPFRHLIMRLSTCASCNKRFGLPKYCGSQDCILCHILTNLPRNGYRLRSYCVLLTIYVGSWCLQVSFLFLDVRLCSRRYNKHMVFRATYFHQKYKISAHGRLPSLLSLNTIRFPIPACYSPVGLAIHISAAVTFQSFKWQG